MERLELKDNLINLYEDDELIYTFDWERLNDIWSYATIDDVEKIIADYEDGNLSVILTTAGGQGGIIALIDVARDEIIHFHNGAFAIKTLLADDMIITLTHVMRYGTTPAYYVDVMFLDFMEFVESEHYIELPDDANFDDDEIVMALDNETLMVEDGINQIEVNISELL